MDESGVGEGEPMTVVSHSSAEHILSAHHAPPGAASGYLIVGGVEFPAIRWVENDGTHVIESIEFDVSGEGKDWPEARDRFFECALDVFSHLADIVSAGDATEYELKVAFELGPRVTAALRGQIARLERRRLSFRRPSSDPSNPWHSQAQMNSKQLSHA